MAVTVIWGMDLVVKGEEVQPSTEWVWPSEQLLSAEWIQATELLQQQHYGQHNGHNQQNVCSQWNGGSGLCS